jgi:hypothetical protein
MLNPQYHMQPEYEIIQRLVEWLSAAGWPELPDNRLEHEMRADTDAVLDTEAGQRILIRAKRRPRGALGRVEVRTYPDSNRIYLLEQPDGKWKIRTESNTFDPRPVDANGVKAVLSEMLSPA